jgi:hypothetical protein
MNEDRVKKVLNPFFIRVNSRPFAVLAFFKPGKCRGGNEGFNREWTRIDAN